MSDILIEEILIYDPDIEGEPYSHSIYKVNGEEVSYSKYQSVILLIW